MEKLYSEIKSKISSLWMVFAISSIILAFEPLMWLIRTWYEPAYNSSGFIIFAACVLLFIWSISSRRLSSRPVNRKLAISLLVSTALIRLIGQLFAVNIIAAIALVVDVYAIGKLSALSYRRRPISSGWLAICFIFCLPLERVIQRTIGYGLQNISADGACSILDAMFGDVTCYGVRIILNNMDVLVDLPCSGARSLLLLLMFYSLCMSICRPTIMQGIAGLFLVIISSIITNILRIIILAVGIAYPDVVYIDVMAFPYHDLIGLLMLFIGSIPIIIFSRIFYKCPKYINSTLDQIEWQTPYSIKRDAWWFEDSSYNKSGNIFHYAGKYFNYKMSQKIGGYVLLLFAIIIVSLPKTAIDVSKKNIDIDLPEYMNGEKANHIALEQIEQQYFTQYGGAAAKANYGSHNIMMVRTSSPLRHLHAPDECLRGLGFDVQYMGVNYNIIPSSIYKAVDKNGVSWRVVVSFISDDGKATSNISEAIWHWLNNRNSVWTTVQRISPWDLHEAENRKIDMELMAYLDIDNSNNNINQQIYLTYKGESND